MAAENETPLERAYRLGEGCGGLDAAGVKALVEMSRANESAPAERPCIFCGEEVTSTNPETDFCRNCFYSGRAAERQLRPLLDRIDEIEEVSRNAAVWHTGGGCFNLAVHLADGRLLTPSVGYVENGGVWPEPGFPADPEDRWCVVVSESEEAWQEWDVARLWIPEALFDDDGLVAAIRDIATGQMTRPEKEA